jgi:type IV pilus assembly protein PilO
MRKDFTSRRRVILGLLAVLVLADCSLAAYSWWQASAPRATRQELDRQGLELKLLRADIERAKGIEQNMPAIQKDCDNFEKSLLPASTGYSSVLEELGTIAQNTGLQISNENFRHKDIPNRELTEVVLEATISGNYVSVVKFLNGLQRSGNVYVVDGLGLASENQTQGLPDILRLSLSVRTYFRTRA